MMGEPKKPSVKISITIASLFFDTETGLFSSHVFAHRTDFESRREMLSTTNLVSVDGEGATYQEAVGAAIRKAIADPKLKKDRN